MVVPPPPSVALMTAPRIHSLDRLQLSEAAGVLDGELLDMEVGTEDTFDSLGLEVAGAYGEIKSERRRSQIIRKNNKSNLKCRISGMENSYVEHKKMDHQKVLLSKPLPHDHFF